MSITLNNKSDSSCNTFQDKKDDFKERASTSGKAPKMKVTDTDLSWPRNRQSTRTGKGRTRKKDDGTLFPFEVEEM